MRRVVPNYPTNPRRLGAILQINQELIRIRLGILGSKHGVSAAMLEPSNDWCVLMPEHNHLVVELVGILFDRRKCDRCAIGEDRGHRVAFHLDTSIFSPRGLPVMPYFR